jgi:hypothetical protein
LKERTCEGTAHENNRFGVCGDRRLCRLVHRWMRRLRAGIEHLRDGVKRNPGDALLPSSLARALAACPDGELRESAEALRLAEQACSDEGRNDPVFLDALAIALFVAKQAYRGFP